MNVSDLADEDLADEDLGVSLDQLDQAESCSNCGCPKLNPSLTACSACERPFAATDRYQLRHSTRDTAKQHAHRAEEYLPDVADEENDASIARAEERTDARDGDYRSSNAYQAHAEVGKDDDSDDDSLDNEMVGQHRAPKKRKVSSSCCGRSGKKSKLCTSARKGVPREKTRGMIEHKDVKPMPNGSTKKSKNNGGVKKRIKRSMPKLVDPTTAQGKKQRKMRDKLLEKHTVGDVRFAPQDDPIKAAAAHYQYLLLRRGYKYGKADGNPTKYPRSLTKLMEANIFENEAAFLLPDAKNKAGKWAWATAEQEAQGKKFEGKSWDELTSSTKKRRIKKSYTDLMHGHTEFVMLLKKEQSDMLEGVHNEDGWEEWNPPESEEDDEERGEERGEDDDEEFDVFADGQEDEEQRGVVADDEECGEECGEEDDEEDDDEERGEERGEEFVQQDDEEDDEEDGEERGEEDGVFADREVTTMEMFGEEDDEECGEEDENADILGMLSD